MNFIKRKHDVENIMFEFIKIFVDMNNQNQKKT